ncbi:MAG: hypothetical protein AAE985_02040 [Thermoplasmataceae archaeon]|jgi:preprotein translocase subunit SecG|nr:MAG: hypothetical protein AMDU2_EPLC00006G0480 [Thermoplasmatales archaeon E-plasma]
MSNNMVIKKRFSAIIGGIFLLIWFILSIIYNKNIMDSNYSQSLQNALLQIDSVLLLSIIIFLTIVLNKKGEDFKLSAYRLRIESMGIAVLFIASASSYFVSGWLYYVAIYYQILGIPAFIFIFYLIFDRGLINAFLK